MTMADLLKLFREGQNDARIDGAIMQGDMDVRGLSYVINALRNDGVFLKTWEEAQMAKAYGKRKSADAPQAD